VSSPGAAEATIPGSPLTEGAGEKYLEAGGVRFRYLEGGSAAGSPVLLLHGWPTWAEVWLPIARRLAPQHRWIAPDLPCQNRSSLLPGNDCSLSAYGRAIDAFVAAVGLTQFAVIGNSMGGTLAVKLALAHPERVTKLVVLDAAGLTPKLPGKTARMYLPFLLPCYFRPPGKDSVRKLLTKAVFHDPRFATDDWVNAIVEAWKPRDRRRAYMATGFALRKPDASVADALPRIRVPTLVLSGRDDVQFRWQSAEEACRRIPGGRFGVIDEAGHFPMVERPDRTWPAISGFLDGPSATR